MLYPTKVKSVYLNTLDTKTAGKLMPTTQIKILEKSDKYVKFELKGYQNPNVQNVIYYIDGQRIISLAFAKTAQPKIKIEKHGENGAWNQVSVEAYTEDSDFVTDINDIYVKAEATYKQSCSVCHPLHAVNSYKANQWPSLFKSMVSRTSIDKDDVYTVIQYLQKHASDIK